VKQIQPMPEDTLLEGVYKGSVASQG